MSVNLMRVVLYVNLGLKLFLSDDASAIVSASELKKTAGAGSIDNQSSLSFSMPVPNLSPEEERRFFKGRALFRDTWTEAPSSTHSRDGLGPTFNARSCESCHIRDGRGKPPGSAKDPLVSLLFRLSVPGEDRHGAPVPVPVYGGQLQPYGISNVPGEGSVEITYTEIKGHYKDGGTWSLRKPNYLIVPALGPMHQLVMISPRVAPQMPGLGLLERIPDKVLYDMSDPDDLDGDGISGKVNLVYDATLKKKVPGRFGWKANQPSLRQQTAGAFLGDIGITSEIFGDNNCPEGQKLCQNSVNGGSPELLPAILDHVVFYSQTLAVPQARNTETRMFKDGFKSFTEIGCGSCHKHQLKTSKSPGPDSLINQSIHPFTDLLLHDMGEGLADHRPDFLASGREWRTPPLWGLGLIPVVNNHKYLLHDGRARTIEEAVLWHAGEAEKSRVKFTELDKQKRDQLLYFLESL